MGEYINYKGEEMKIGTCEDLYYVSYEKYVKALQSGQLKKVRGSDEPENYALPDSGFRFRFPFPDEDKNPFGDYANEFDKGIAVTIDKKGWSDDSFGRDEESSFQMMIKQQKLVHREIDGKLCLALVWRDPVTQQLLRTENDADVNHILNQIFRNHVAHETDTVKKGFYRELACVF